MASVTHESEILITITNKTPLMLKVETQHGRSIEEIIDQLAQDRARSFNEKAKDLGVGFDTLDRWFGLLGYKRLSMREALQRLWTDAPNRMLAKVHPPGSDYKRSDSVRASWDRLSQEERAKRTKNAREATKAAKRRESDQSELAILDNQSLSQDAIVEQAIKAGSFAVLTPTQRQVVLMVDRYIREGSTRVPYKKIAANVGLRTRQAAQESYISAISKLERTVSI